MIASNDQIINLRSKEAIHIISFKRRQLKMNSKNIYSIIQCVLILEGNNERIVLHCLTRMNSRKLSIVK